MLKRKVVENNHMDCHNNLSPIRFQRKGSNISPGKSPIRSRSPIRISSPFRPSKDYRTTSPIKFVKNQCIKKISSVLATKKQQNGLQDYYTNQQNHYKKIQHYNKISEGQNHRIKPLGYEKLNIESDRFIPQQKGKLFSKLVQKLNSDKKQQQCRIIYKNNGYNEVGQFNINKEESKLRTGKTPQRNKMNANKTIQNVQIVQSTQYQKQKQTFQQMKQANMRYVETDSKVVNNNIYNEKKDQNNNRNYKNHQTHQIKQHNHIIPNKQINPNNYMNQNNSNYSSNYNNPNSHSVKSIKDKIVKKQSEKSNSSNLIEQICYKNTQIQKNLVQKDQQADKFTEQYETMNMYLMKLKQSYKLPQNMEKYAQSGNIKWSNSPVDMSLNMNPFM